MKHWLTIGALDPEEWKVHLGGYWRQRAGRLIASGKGTGFGGRTLCIAQQKPPEDKFAAEVEVKVGRRVWSSWFSLLPRREVQSLRVLSNRWLTSTYPLLGSGRLQLDDSRHD